jgi:predicted regulator of Ras-like GTPase activity (Roadblock/LC7/MglB family)
MNMLSSKRVAAPALIAIAKQQALEILNNVSGIDSVLLCSTDGFELASVHKRSSYDGNKIAAVSSSILAMVSAFVGEIKLIGCQSITLDAANGKAVICAVPAKNHPMVLVITASQDVLLGQVFHAIKQVNATIMAADLKYGF